METLEKTAPASMGRAGERLQVADLVIALREDGWLAPMDADRLVSYANLSRADVPALVWLAERRLRIPGGEQTLDLDRLSEWLARRSGLPYVRIDPLKVDFSRISEVMSSQYASRFGILPLDASGGEVVIATAEPFVTDWVEELAQLTRKRVRRVIANPAEIRRYIDEFFRLARSVRGAQRLGGASPQQNFEQLVELGKAGSSLEVNDQHIVNIVDWLWQYAFDQRASDIHLEPRRESCAVRFRIDGVLNTVYRVPPQVLAAMISRVKLLGRMDVVEKRHPQDGRIKTRTTAGGEIELRLSTLPTAFGEKMVMRIFDPEVLTRDFLDLGFVDEDQAIWTEMISRPGGILLVTGPTGSGKTTTLYATLKRLASDEVNVCTIEDPIEMVEPAFNQMQVQSGIDLGFADGIRALMRQDPDIIMIGEIRDLETAEMAVQAALTGHLVLSSLHTNDSTSAVTRLLDLGVPAYLIDATLVGVMAQRLVRLLCPSCKAEVDPTDPRWEQLIRPFRAPPPTKLYRPVGCTECRRTGYRGRAGLYEILRVDQDLRGLLTEAPDWRSIRSRALQAGLKPLRLAGAAKIAQGLTTIDEVLRNAPPIES